jgi:hypothetical protein
MLRKKRIFIVFSPNPVTTIGKADVAAKTPHDESGSGPNHGTLHQSVVRGTPTPGWRSRQTQRGNNMPAKSKAKAPSKRTNAAKNEKEAQKLQSARRKSRPDTMVQGSSRPK